MAQVTERLTSADRYVDFGIALHVVEQDPDGFQVAPGQPRLRTLRTHHLGGIVDTLHRRLVCRSDDSEYAAWGGDPHVWYCSEAQEPIVLHFRDRTDPAKRLVYGAFGSGKTTVLSMAAVILCLQLCEDGHTDRRPVYIGATAPTRSRLDILFQGLRNVCRPEWYTTRVMPPQFRLACGVVVELVATKEQSSSVGSPVQGQNWMGHVGDEYQDQTHASAHIQARGRTAPEGIYRQVCTATAKDSMRWREFRDGMSDDWRIHRLEGRSNVFVHAEWWERCKDEMSAREYKRMVLAQDVGPERAVYTSWERDLNLRPIPRIGAIDVTASILRGYGPNHTLLVGHDPGVLRNVSVMLKCYETRGVREWYVVDEFETHQTTTEQHAQDLMRHLATDGRWGIGTEYDENRVAVRTDPWSHRDAGTHKSVYTQFQQAGFSIRSAAYNAKGEGRGSMPLHASVEMLNRLMCASSGRRRLFVAQNEAGKSAAPDTVRAIELSEWDPWGQRELARKDDKKKDPTDHTSCLRYALWPYEKVRPTTPRNQRRMVL